MCNSSLYFLHLKSDRLERIYFGVYKLHPSSYSQKLFPFSIAFAPVSKAATLP